MHFPRTCREGSTKDNEFPINSRKHLFLIFFPEKKAFPKGPSGSVEPTCDSRAVFFAQNYILCSNFWKISAQNLRENTKLLEFCSEKKQSPGKSFFRQINRIFDNQLENHHQSTTIFREGSQKISFVSFSSSKRSFGNRDAFFINMPKKQQKGKNSMDFFRKNMWFLKKTLRKRRILFWQPCWCLSAKRSIFPKSPKKILFKIWDKLSTCLSFYQKRKSPGKNPLDTWKALLTFDWRFNAKYDSFPLDCWK